MKKTTVTFAILPHRVSDGPGAKRKLRLSVFVSPRLWATELAEQEQIFPLSDYPAFLAWPTTVAGMKFDVRFSGAPPQRARVVQEVELRPDLWEALFPGAIPVKPYRYDNLANTPIQTIDSAYLEDWLREVYRRVGTDSRYGAGADKPSSDVMHQDVSISAIANSSQPEEIYEPPDKPRTPPKPGAKGTCCLSGCLMWVFVLINALFKLLKLKPPFSGASATPAPLAEPAKKGETPVPGNTGMEANAGAPGGTVLMDTPNLTKQKFDEVVAFIQPFKPADVIPPKLTDEQLANRLDFHEAVALAADYPTLLRALGLVIDLEVDWEVNIPEAGMIWLELDSLPSVETIYCPKTHYQLANGCFTARSRPKTSGQPEMRNGLLLLGDENRYRVVQTDVVGAVVKMQNAATNIVAHPGLQPANLDAEQTLPALRSAGLSIVQRDLAASLYATYMQSIGLNNALAEQDGSPAATLLPTTDHPVVQQPNKIDELFAEDLTRGYRMDVKDLDSASKQWRSLHQRTGECRMTRPDPGIVFPVTDEAFSQLATAEPATPDAQQVQRIHDALITWPGWSLAAVRPGKALVESNRPEETAQHVQNAAKTQFKMVSHFTPVHGSLPRLRFGHSYLLRVRTVDLAGNSVFGPEDVEFQADHYGYDTHPYMYRRFEPVASPAVVLRGAPIEGESVERLVLRSNPTIPIDSVRPVEVPDAPDVTRLTVERHVAPPKQAQQMAELHGEFDNGPVMKHDQAAYDLASLEAGTLSHRLNLVTGKLELIPHTETRPPGSDAKIHTFWQEGAAFPLSYLPDNFARAAVFGNLPGMTPQMVALGKNRYQFDGDWPERLPFRLVVKGILYGQAPQNPLFVDDPAHPVHRTLEIELPQSETRVLRISSGMDQADMALMGVWRWETIPATPNQAQVVEDTQQGRNWLLMPYRELVLVHATQRPVELPVLQLPQSKVEKKEFETSATIEATCEVHGPTTAKVDLLAFWDDPLDVGDNPPERSMSRAVLGEYHVTSPDLDSISMNAVHNLGDTKYHRVIYVPRGSTRFLEYMPEDLRKKENVDLISAPNEAEIKWVAPTIGKEVDIKNSARPQAPVLAYAVPTFGPAEQTSQTTPNQIIVTRVRKGNGLRVYLKRPWFSSGEGELLGVVYKKDKHFKDLSESLRPYVSEWANDPIWVSGPADMTPSEANFINYAEKRDNVVLEETGVHVSVVGYPVEFDKERNMWFADIELNLGQAYTPMMRLALVRFQPKSVGDAFISRVVRTDFMQVFPERTLTIRRGKILTDPVTYTLRLDGTAPGAAGLEGISRARAWIEKHEIPSQGELGWRVQQDFQAEWHQDSDAIWEGVFRLPETLAGAHRMVVQEVELIGNYFNFDFDPETIGGLSTPMLPGLGRTVYADTYML